MESCLLQWWNSWVERKAAGDSSVQLPNVYVCMSVCEGVGCAQWKVNSVHVTFLWYFLYSPTKELQPSDDERTVNILISLVFSFSLVFYSYSFPFQGNCRSVSALCGLRSHDSVMTDHVWAETELLFMNEMCCLRWLNYICTWVCVCVHMYVYIYVYTCERLCNNVYLRVQPQRFLLLFPLCWFILWITALCVNF